MTNWSFIGHGSKLLALTRWVGSCWPLYGPGLNFSDGKEMIDGQSEQGGGPEKAIDMSKAARLFTSESGK